MQEAYKPLSQNNRAYQVYALVDPRDGLVHYVGVSLNVHVRYHGYMTGGAVNKRQRAWFLDLERQGMSPILQILETIEASSNSHELACDRELYWIQEMSRAGHPLLNVIGITRGYIPATVFDNRKPLESKPEIVEVEAVQSEPESKPIHSRSQEKMLTVKQIADRMSVDERTVRGWIQKGELKAVNIAGRRRPEYRIRPDDFEEFLKSRETDKNE